MFPTRYSEILQRIDQIDPVQYGKTRNYLDGAVTRLSPYISRGVISTRQVAKAILKKGYAPHTIESFLQELAWRDYFQQVWRVKGDAINTDLKQAQPQVAHPHIPLNIVQAQTGISAIDTGITELYRSGYMHNHVRMYVASIACNIAWSHWLAPAKWMYFHLLDADWASNALSWQWVAGSFSSKKYYANQENINRYCYTHDKNTFLDVDYTDFETMNIPDILKETVELSLSTTLPETPAPVLNKALPTYVYTFYNLDPNWDAEVDANRILLFEPSFFNTYPVSTKTIEFILDLSKNIPNLQIVTGEFTDVFKAINKTTIHFKEHPTNQHFEGTEHRRDWIFEAVQGYYPSFFSYWKQCKKNLDALLND